MGSIIKQGFPRKIRKNPAQSKGQEDGLLSLVICHLSFVICHLSFVPCPLSPKEN